MTDVTGNLASMAFSITNNRRCHLLHHLHALRSRPPPLACPLWPASTSRASDNRRWSLRGGSSLTFNLSFTTGDMAPVFKQVNDNGGTSYFVVSQLAGMTLAPSVLTTGSVAGGWNNTAAAPAGWAPPPLASCAPAGFDSDSGTAIYHGQTIGAATTSTGGNLMVLTGSILLTANFGTGQMTTAISGITTQNVETNAIGVIPDLGGTQIDHSRYLPGHCWTGAGGYTGRLSGGFIGAGCGGDGGHPGTPAMAPSAPSGAYGAK